MDFEIVNLEEKVVEGIGVRTTNENGKAVEDIAKVWQSLFANNVYESIDGKVNNKTIGLYTDYEGDYTKPYYFIAGAEVNKSNNSVNMKDTVVKVIPKGKYAKFVVVGDVQKTVGAAWGKIWNLDLKRKYTCDFEEYQNNSDDMQNQEIHIYIALED